ncbi:DUF222 domain-containing protein [Actinocrispum sp. NPDC049592]|uniref:DUF222 domain-containing protein n=1 Tax=Actinocrispum sp. NPDC049592 TaxID=3154835 RepID=UPI00343C0D22
MRLTLGSLPLFWAGILRLGEKRALAARQRHPEGQGTKAGSGALPRFARGTRGSPIPGEETVAALQDVEAQGRRIEYTGLELVAYLNNQGLANDLGYSNPAALLVHALRISPKEAKRRLAQAEALFASITPTGSVIEPALPATSAALAAGDLGSEAVDVIRKTLKDLPDLEPKQPDRMLHIRARRDRGLDFRGHLPAEDAHLLHPVIKKGEQRPTDRADDRSQAERIADAFVETLRMAARCPAKPTKNGLRTQGTAAAPSGEARARNRGGGRCLGGCSRTRRWGRSA